MEIISFERTNIRLDAPSVKIHRIAYCALHDFLKIVIHDAMRECLVYRHSLGREFLEDREKMQSRFDQLGVRIGHVEMSNTRLETEVSELKDKIEILQASSVGF